MHFDPEITPLGTYLDTQKSKNMYSTAYECEKLETKAQG